MLKTPEPTKKITFKSGSTINKLYNDDDVDNDFNTPLQIKPQDSPYRIFKNNLDNMKYDQINI